MVHFGKLILLEFLTPLSFFKDIDFWPAAAGGQLQFAGGKNKMLESLQFPGHHCQGRFEFRSIDKKRDCIFFLKSAKKKVRIIKQDLRNLATNS